MARKQEELEKCKAADEAAAIAAIGEDEAEEKRTLLAAKKEAQKSKTQQQALAGGAGATAASAFHNDPHYAKLGLHAGVDLFAKPTPSTSSNGPVRRGSNIRPFTSPTGSSNGLPPKIAPATAFAGNPFAPKPADGGLGRAAPNPFAPSGSTGSAGPANPFGAPVTAGGTAFGGSDGGGFGGSQASTMPAGMHINAPLDPYGGRVADAGQAAAAAGSFFNSLQQSGAATSAATSGGRDPFHNPPELPPHSGEHASGGGEVEEDDMFNPDTWKPAKGSTLKANAGGYITYTVAGDDESDDDESDDDDDDTENESSTMAVISETPESQRDRIIAEKAKEIMMLQESLQHDKERFAEVQERQRTESKSKKKGHFFERFRNVKKGSTHTM
jgi:hypothetical protein